MNTDHDDGIYPNDEDSLEGMIRKYATTIRAKYREFGRLGRTRQLLWLGAMTLVVPGLVLMVVGTFGLPWNTSTGAPLARHISAVQLGLILGAPVGLALGETVAFRPGRIATIISVVATAVMNLWILSEATGRRTDAAAVLVAGAALVLAATIINAISAWLPKQTR